MADPLDQMIADVVGEYFRSKIQTQDIRNYAGANMAFNHAADIANKLGLSNEQKAGVAPFPGRPNVTNLQVGDPQLADRIAELVSAIKQPTGEPAATQDQPAVAERVSSAAKWIVPLIAGVSGAGTLGAGLLVFQSLFGGTPGNSTPTNKGAETGIDANVGLEIEGIRPWKKEGE